MRGSFALAARRLDVTRDDGRMRMTVLGGYLGSGKTTWLRHQLHHGQFKDALVIVNEVAETPVDAAILGDVPNLAVLVGGCVCCEAQGELVHLLRDVCDARSGFDSSDERLQRIVLETSGLADPRPIVEAVRNDSVLVHHIVVSEIIVAVDALHALEQLRSERLGRAQMEVADRLVVTKIDAAQPGVTRLLATLRRLNPGAVISGSARGSVVSLPACDDADSGAHARAAGRSCKVADLCDQAASRSVHRLDRFQRLAVGFAPRTRRRCASRQGGSAYARRTDVVAKRTKDSAVAGDPARAG